MTSIIRLLFWRELASIVVQGFYASFDQSVSPLNNTSNGVGNIELGFQYIINSAKNKRMVPPDILRNQGN
ncbi:MAG: hypothetical protein HC803_02085 [Saprospiraceae bacterium]|nr:hypothetical protein [Saprospiraceae bacterium]